MKHIIGKGQLSDKHEAILKVITRLQERSQFRRQVLLFQLANDRNNPRFRRFCSRYFRAIERLEKIALHYNFSAVQDEIILIGRHGFLTLPNWARRQYIKFTQGDKNRLAKAKPEAIECLFKLLQESLSTVILRETRDIISRRLCYELTDFQEAKTLADLAVWTEIKSGFSFYAAPHEISDELSIFTKFITGDRMPRRKPAPGDTLRIDTVLLSLYQDFSQCFIGCEPKPIAVFNVFQIFRHDTD